MKWYSIILLTIIVVLYIPALELIRILVFDVKLYSYNFTFFDFYFLSSSINIIQLILVGANRLLIKKKQLLNKKVKVLVYSNVLLYLVLTVLYLTDYMTYVYFLLLPFSVIIQVILVYYFIFDLNNWLNNPKRFANS